MRRIMVANPKGGSGKSTLAIHMASWFACCDELVCLGDFDRQQSSSQWLKRRPDSLSPIRHWQPGLDTGQEPPKDCRVAILDTPAGLHGKELKALLRSTDRIVVPVSPSRFDMQASQDFFAELAETKAVRKERIGIAVVGMRVAPRTHATQELVNFLQQFNLPLVTCIRNSQRYVHAVESGVTLFDKADCGTKEDRSHWRPLLDWLSARK